MMTSYILLLLQYKVAGGLIHSNMDPSAVLVSPGAFHPQPSERPAKIWYTISATVGEGVLYFSISEKAAISKNLGTAAI